MYMFFVYSLFVSTSTYVMLRNAAYKYIVFFF